MRLLVATGNPHKVEEFRRILDGRVSAGDMQPVELLAPADLGLSPDVEETGKTFMENAELKARALFERGGVAAVADDSGLCVDALDGRPGVYSARYHGEDTPYPEKIAALLGEMRAVPDEERTARFVCAICCVLDAQTVLRCECACEGTIGRAPSGSGGFGYDPVFYVGARSFAQLSGAEKDAVSHRGRALRRMAALLEAHGRRTGSIG